MKGLFSKKDKNDYFKKENKNNVECCHKKCNRVGEYMSNCVGGDEYWYCDKHSKKCAFDVKEIINVWKK